MTEADTLEPTSEGGDDRSREDDDRSLEGGGDRRWLSERARWSRPTKWVAAWYAVLVGAFLWPVPIRPRSTIYGYGGDGFGFIWEMGRRPYTIPFFFRRTFEDNLSYPFGYEQSNLTRITSVVPDLIAIPLSRLVGGVATYNALIAIGLVSTALAASWLLMYATRSRSVGFWGGVAFTLFPFIQLAATSWPSFTHIYWLPLVVLAALQYGESASARRLLLIALPVAGAWLTNPYVGFFAFVVLLGSSAIWLPAAVVEFRGASLRTRRLTVWAVVGATLGSLFAAAVVIVALRGTVERSLAELDVYGLRVEELLRPTSLTRWSSDWIRPIAFEEYHGSNSVEIAQFVGWSTIALALVGLLSPRSKIAELRQRRASLLGIGVGLFFGMSQLVVAGLVPTPGRLLHEVAPFFRVYSRFGVVVFLFLLLAAAHGASVLVLDRSSVQRRAIVGGLCLITFVELWSPLPGRFTEIERPEFVGSIDGGAPAVIAMYPIVRSDEAYFYMQLLWSLHLPHDSRLVNGGPIASDGEGLRQQLRSLGSATTWDDLDDLLVDYVIVDMFEYESRYGYAVELEGRDVIYRDDRFAVVSLADHTEGFVGWTSGDQYGTEVREDGPSWRWIGDDTKLNVRSSTPQCVTVTASVVAPDGNVELSILTPDGREIAATGGDDELSVALPVEAGTTTFVIDPSRSKSQLSESDLRTATLYLSDVDVSGAPAASCG